MSSAALARALRAAFDGIVAQWIRAERQRTHDDALSDEVLTDDLPVLLDELASALEAQAQGRPPPPRESAARHALHRWRIDMGLSRLTGEYATLRQVLLDRLDTPQIGASRAAWVLLHGLLDAALDDCISVYVERLTGAIEKERQRFLVALQRAPVIVFEQDRDLRYSWAHPSAAARELVGHTEREVVDDPGALGEIVHLKQQALDQGVPVSAQVRTVRRGQEAHFWLCLEPLRGRDGEICGLLGAASDITHRIRQEAALRDALELRERLIGIVSHDLRNPLNAVELSASMLLRKGDLDERQELALQRIRRAAQRAGRLICELLDYTRVRSGGLLPVQPTPCDGGAIVEQVVNEVALAFPDRHVRVDVARDADLRLRADPERVAQALMNLVRNALQHSQEGTPVEVRLSADGAAVSFAVHNEGPPIPTASQARLFEPFTRGEGQRAGDNVGLGLYIVQQIVRAHGGDVSIASTASEGTTFTLALPRDGRPSVGSRPEDPAIAARPS
jgi:signal transduction histidine kinase